MTIVRIMSLGEVVSQNHAKALSAFTRLIKPEAPAQVAPLIGKLLQSEQFKSLLNSLKQGYLSQADFIQRIIADIQEITGVQITPEAFVTAWNAMNPTYETFSPRLIEVLQERKGDVKLIFVSHTNPIDIDYLMKQLAAHGVPFGRDDSTGELNRIGEVPLYLTYVAKKSKADLILNIIQEETRLHAEQRPISPGLFGAKAAGPKPLLDIKYIRSLPNTLDTIIAALSKSAQDEVDQTTELHHVETLFWDLAKGQSFKDVVQGTNASHVPAVLL